MILFILFERRIFRGNWTDLDLGLENLTKDHSNRIKITVEKQESINGLPVYDAKIVFYNVSNYVFPVRNFHLFGIAANNQTNFYMFSFPRTTLTIEKAISILQTSAEVAKLKDYENITLLDSALKARINNSLMLVSLATLKFSVNDKISTGRVFDLNTGVNGTFEYEKTFVFSAALVNYPLFIMEGKKFGVLVAFVIVINFIAWRSLYKKCSSTASLIHLSLSGFIMHISFDFSFSLFFIDISIAAFEFVALFSFLFMCTTIIFTENMQLIALIWRAHHPDAEELTNDGLRLPFLQFFVQISVLMFLYSFATSIVLDAPVLSLLFLYSFFIPQIIHSSKTPGRKKGDGIFNVLVSFQRLIPLWYMTFYRANIHESYSIKLGLGITSYVVVQLIIVSLQNAFGGFFFLPYKYRPKEFDYSSVPPPPGSECAICMTPIEEGDDSVMTPCQHPFHKECLARWLEEDMICPICRAHLPPVNS